MRSEESTSPLTHRTFDGPAGFVQALRDAFDLAARDRPTELRLCDADFADWPLGEPSVIDALTRWIGGPRRLLLLGRSFDGFERRHPRWIAWRRVWSHRVECRTNLEAAADPWPSLLVAPGSVAVARIDRERCRGWSTAEPARIVGCIEQFDALSQRSAEAFPPTTLGL